ncbi:MAG: hypothetical protein AABZ60_17870 [Planctomycetota bacterium]
MRYFFFCVLVFSGEFLFAQNTIQGEPLFLQYNFKALENTVAHYRIRSVMEVQTIRNEISRNEKTTLDSLQSRTFQPQTNCGLICIRFQEARFFYEYDLFTPEQTPQRHSIAWNSSQPEFVSTSEWGNKEIKEVPKPFQKQIVWLPELLSQPLKMQSSTSGELLKLEWLQHTEEQLENIKNSWILLPSEPVALGARWSQSFQEKLSGLGTLNIQINYLFKEWLAESQTARVDGYFEFTLDDTFGRARYETQTTLSEDSGKIVFEFDCAKGLITKLSRDFQFTITLTIPTEASQTMTLKTKIYHHLQETLE